MQTTIGTEFQKTCQAFIKLVDIYQQDFIEGKFEIEDAREYADKIYEQEVKACDLIKEKYLEAITTDCDLGSPTGDFYMSSETLKKFDELCREHNMPFEKDCDDLKQCMIDEIDLYYELIDAVNLEDLI